MPIDSKCAILFATKSFKSSPETQKEHISEDYFTDTSMTGLHVVDIVGYNNRFDAAESTGSSNGLKKRTGLYNARWLDSVSINNLECCRFLRAIHLQEDMLVAQKFHSSLRYYVQIGSGIDTTRKLATIEHGRYYCRDIADLRII